MPAGDGTGPFGTFRNCMPVDSAGNPVAGPFYGRGFFGRGLGMGFGRGRGFRWRFLATGVLGRIWFGQQQQQNVPAAQQQYAPAAQQQYKPTAEERENEINMLEQDIEAIKRRIEELKKQ